MDGETKRKDGGGAGAGLWAGRLAGVVLLVAWCVVRGHHLDGGLFPHFARLLVSFMAKSAAQICRSIRSTLCLRMCFATVNYYAFLEPRPEKKESKMDADAPCCLAMLRRQHLRSHTALTALTALTVLTVLSSSLGRAGSVMVVRRCPSVGTKVLGFGCCANTCWQKQSGRLNCV